MFCERRKKANRATVTGVTGSPTLVRKRKFGYPGVTKRLISRQGRCQNRKSGCRGFTNLEVIAVTVFLSLTLLAVTSYQSLSRQFQISVQSAKAQHLADQNEVLRQGYGTSVLPAGKAHFSGTDLETIYHVQASSEGRVSVWFGNSGERHTLHARPSRQTRGVIDKVQWYRETVR